MVKNQHIIHFDHLSPNPTLVESIMMYIFFKHSIEIKIYFDHNQKGQKYKKLNSKGQKIGLHIIWERREILIYGGAVNKFFYEENKSRPFKKLSDSPYFNETFSGKSFINIRTVTIHLCKISSRDPP